MTELVQLLLSAPDSQMDPSLKDSIRSWSSPTPKALEVLKSLDECVHVSSGSGFVVTVLDTIFKSSCALEGVSEAEVISKASWRK